MPAAGGSDGARTRHQRRPRAPSPRGTGASADAPGGDERTRRIADACGGGGGRARGVRRALAESQTLAEAAPRLLEVVCRGLDWEMGALWRVDSDEQVIR